MSKVEKDDSISAEVVGLIQQFGIDTSRAVGSEESYSSDGESCYQVFWNRQRNKDGTKVYSVIVSFMVVNSDNELKTAMSAVFTGANMEALQLEGGSLWSLTPEAWASNRLNAEGMVVNKSYFRRSSGDVFNDDRGLFFPWNTLSNSDETVDFRAMAGELLINAQAGIYRRPQLIMVGLNE